MPHIQRQYLFFAALFAYLICLASFPASLYSQDLQSPPGPHLSGSISDGASQKNEIEVFFAQFNGCAWYRTPGDSVRDVYFELKDGTLILYEYLKNQSYCYITSTTCFTQEELWRMKVTGYDNTFTDRRGNAYRVVINRDGKTITTDGSGKTVDSDYAIGTFVKIFCSDKTWSPANTY
jgi:hypothetical protein